jgi:hypothetical protein
MSLKITDFKGKYPTRCKVIYLNSVPEKHSRVNEILLGSDTSYEAEWKIIIKHIGAKEYVAR